MPIECTATAPSSAGMSPFRSISTSKFGFLLFYIFFAISVTAVFIPLNPRMPSAGLDASWQYAMNEAVAKHMSFGKEIIFTYGPYASICTRTYSPATDRRMILGSVLLAASYVIALLFIAAGKKRVVILILLLFLATYGAPEYSLMSYAFLLVLCTLKQVNSHERDLTGTHNWRQFVAIIVLWSTLGLLPVVKGSLVLPFAAAVAATSLLLLYRGWVRLALLLLVVPLAAAVTFWVIAGQSLSDIPAFLRATAALTSGYTDAMSTPWVVLPGIVGDTLVVAFLAATGLVFLSIGRAPKFTVPSKLMLALILAVFLLVAFKHGFIASTAVTIAFSTLVILNLTIALLRVDRYLIWSLCIALVLTVFTSVTRDAVLLKEVHEKFGVGAAEGGEKQREILAYCLKKAFGAYGRTTYVSTWNTYRGAWHGLVLRLTRSGELKDSYLRAEESVRDAYPIPALIGTVDIYEVDQSFLIASKNEWNPRPIIQSYSAYTPDLARLNAEHLRGADAPDWVLFDLQSIDRRLPSLDDGLSWPALLDNYAFVSYDGQFVSMHKKPSIREISSYDSVGDNAYKTGSTVTLPDADGLLFAQVDLNPTLAGKVLLALFNPPQLHIVVGLANGQTKVYRVVSDMMRTDFLVSPLVSNTDEFASLMAGGENALKEDRVQTISIAPSYGGSIFWSDTLKVERYR